MPQGQQKEGAEGRSYPWQLRSQDAADSNSQQTRVLHKSMKPGCKGMDLDPYLDSVCELILLAVLFSSSATLPDGNSSCSVWRLRDGRMQDHVMSHAPCRKLPANARMWDAVRSDYITTSSVLQKLVIG